MPGGDAFTTFAFNYNNMSQVFRLRAGPPKTTGEVWTQWYIQAEGSLKPKVLGHEGTTGANGELKLISAPAKGDWNGDRNFLWEIGSAGPGLW